MKICFLAHAASVRTRRLAGYLRDAGHAVEIVSLTPAAPIDDVPVHALQGDRPIRFERTNWRYVLSLPSMRAILGRIRPDLVYAQFVSSYGVMAALACPRRLPLALAVQGRDLLAIPEHSPLHRAAASLALRRADLVLSPAAHLSDAVRRFRPDADILTLQYGVDLQVFANKGPAGSRAPVVLSARALVPGKGIETILQAARILEGRRSPLTVEIADDGPLRQTLEAGAQDLIACGRVRFVGALDAATLASRLNASPIVVSMTETDGTSMTLMEAMACGAFPVASDIPANRPWIAHDRTGFLVPLGDARALADSLERAWSEPALRQRAADANARRIADVMDVRKNLPKIEAALRRTANAGRARHTQADDPPV